MSHTKLHVYSLLAFCGFVLIPMLSNAWAQASASQDDNNENPGNFARKLIWPVKKPPLRISSNYTEKGALDFLLSTNGYDKRLLPPSRDAIHVNVSVLLLTLASPDESSLKYEVEFLMNLLWEDVRLKYEIYSSGPPPDYDPTVHEIPIREQKHKKSFLDALHHYDLLWVPDVYFVKHGDFRSTLDPINVALRIFPNGTVFFTMRRHLILSCQGDLEIFPFDDPVCSFAIESISHEKDALQFYWWSNTGTLRKSPNLSFLNAYLAMNETSYCNSSHWRGNYSCLLVELVFNRDRAFYFTTVFIPDIILVTSSFITFWLEWNAVPARVMLGVTTMLNFFTTSNTFRSTLPVVSNLLAMNIWDGFSMFFIYASLLEFVIVNYIGRKRPRRMYIATDQAALQLNKVEGNPLDTPASPQATLTENNRGEIPMENSGQSSIYNHLSIPTLRRHIVENPIRVAKTIDVVSRGVFPMAYCVFLIFFFVKHKAFVENTGIHVVS